MDFEQYVYDRVVPVIRSWQEEGIYAISFFVYSNEAYVYRGTENVGVFAVSYNTEEDCERRRGGKRGDGEALRLVCGNRRCKHRV